MSERAIATTKTDTYADGSPKHNDPRAAAATDQATAQREFAVTTEESALPYIVIAASKSEARETIESQHLHVMWVEYRRSQCDKCKRWVQASTVKTQAGVTFCAACQSKFVDWIGRAALATATDKG